MLSLSSKICAIPDQVSSDLDGETIVLSVTSGKYFGLEGTGSDIWGAIQKPTTISEICEQLMHKYAIEQVQCQTDTIAFLQELLDHNIVETVV